MISKAFLMAAILGLVIPGLPRCYASQSEKREIEEQKIVAKIAREKNPGKKARLEVRLARMKLLDASSAYDHNDFSKGQALLREYWQLVSRSWETLESTRRGTRKHFKAYKALEISLREDRRRLEDLSLRVPYPESESIQKIEEESSRLHGRVLGVIFPGTTPLHKSTKPRRLSGSGDRVRG